jgi:hypothetical protein
LLIWISKIRLRYVKNSNLGVPSIVMPPLYHSSLVMGIT